MIAAIHREVAVRGIARLCHFTPSRNLLHIVTDPRGLLSTAALREDERAVLNPTDLSRLDGLPDHVCCSVQYPNAWYFRNARDADRIFLDWVVLFIHPRHLWLAGTKFCPRNAAAAGGRLINGGVEGFSAMFAETVEGARGQTFGRSSRHPAYWPTDDQAEVLIPDRVAREDLLGFAVADDSQARREAARLETLGVPCPPITVAPDFYAPRAMSAKVRHGQQPDERNATLGGTP